METHAHISMWSTLSKSLHPLLQISMIISSDAQVSIAPGLEASGFADEQFHTYIYTVHGVHTMWKMSQ